MNKHTPGPWTMETVRTSSGVVFKVGPFPWRLGKLNHACIYADYPSSKEYAECVANAYLIAAAPDLLEKLDHLVQCCDALNIVGPDVEEARAAIAKAAAPTIQHKPADDTEGGAA